MGSREETNGGLNIKETHLLGDIADADHIKQGQQETVEQSSDEGW